MQPVTRSTLRIELTLTPDFQWDQDIHGTAQTFWIIVEDVDGEIILFHDQFLLRDRFCEQDHYITFTVPIVEPQPPNYFVTVVSDRWLHCETRLPVSFQHLILPDKFAPPTPLLDLQALPISALQNPEFEKIFVKSIQSFNKVKVSAN